MPPVARKDDLTVCPSTQYIFIPHVGGQLENAMPVCAEVNGKPVIRLADHSKCQFGAPKDVVVEGSATVELCGLPIARVGDHMIHGGLIITGSPNVEVGGPKFSLPETIQIKGTPEFQNATVRDLYQISETPSGQEMFRRLDAAKQPVVINQHTGTNGYCSPADGADAAAGTPTGSSILYNPDYRSNAYDSSGDLLPQPPVVILFHEMNHALANSEGRHRSGTDPSAPASEPTIEEEEAQAIGTGSHETDYPSENSLRRDLGLDRRDNHYGTGGPTSGEPTPLDLRPGEC